MTTKDERYKQGKIYMLESASAGLVYYGSTCLALLSKRLYGHKSHYERYKLGKRDYITSFKILEQPDYKIVLVEEYPCNNKQELEAREAYYIRNNECVNKVIPQRTAEEWQKKWYQENKEHKKQYRDNYRSNLENKEKAKIQRKIYLAEKKLTQ